MTKQAAQQPIYRGSILDADPPAQGVNIAGRITAKGLDLNQNWALVDRDWCCPACGRNKVDIFRLSSRGILLAKIEEHHDHLRDYVGRRARELFGENWLPDARPGSGHIVDALENLVSSFSRELICSECNSADGKAKVILKGLISPHFSFAPSEIRGFIDPAPNADHRIDKVRLDEIWRRCEPSFNERLTFIDRALRMAHAGMLYRERGTPSFRTAQRQFDPQFQLYKEFLRESDRDERGRELTRMIDEFLARSVQKDSPIVAPKVKAPVSGNIGPTDAEYLAYCDPVSPRRWRQVGEEWCCPICKRSKRQVIRKSKSGKWAGGVRELIEPIEEKDEVSIQSRRRLLSGFSHTFVMSGSTSTLVCSDCAEIVPQIKLRRSDISDIHLTRDDLASCVTAVQPHAPHGVDWEEVALRAMSNRSIGPAWDAYWKHRSFVGRVADIFRMAKRSRGGDAAALGEVTEEVMFVAEIDNRTEAVGLAKWLLLEHARFNEEADRQKAQYLIMKAGGGVE